MLASRKLVSGLILAVLLLQGAATFLSIDSALWPFTDYPMYDGAVKPGVRTNRYSLFAVFDDADDREVGPEELGLTRFQFDKTVVPLLMKYRDDDDHRNKLRDFAALYSAWHQGPLPTLRSFRLENKPLIFTLRGFEPAPPRITTVDLPDPSDGSP